MQNSADNDKEAWIVANGIVDELLMDVFIHIEKITGIHEQLGIHEEFERGIRIEVGVNRLVDVFHDNNHDMIVTGFSHRHSSYQIVQLSVTKQHKSGYCGHHALHNALLARRMCQASSTDEIQELIKILKSTPAYWWRYWLSVRQLLNCVTFDTWWPWTEDHITTGDMERSFLHYLLEQHHPATSSDPPILVMQVINIIIRFMYIVKTILIIVCLWIHARLSSTCQEVTQGNYNI